MSKIRVLVCDDQPAFRDGLCRFLADENDFEIVARLSEGKEAIRLATTLHPDVTIINVVLPDILGIEVARAIKLTLPNAAILMISAHNQSSYVLDSLDVGASGYLLKTVPVEHLIAAVRMVYKGDVVFEGKALNLVLRRARNGKNGANHRARSEDNELRQRELEILKLVARGISNKQIAAHLAISERTVQSHIVRMFKKLDVESRTSAVVKALQDGWLSLEQITETGDSLAEINDDFDRTPEYATKVLYN